MLDEAGNVCAGVPASGSIALVVSGLCRVSVLGDRKAGPLSGHAEEHRPGAARTAYGSPGARVARTRRRRRRPLPESFGASPAAAPSPVQTHGEVKGSPVGCGRVRNRSRGSHCLLTPCRSMPSRPSPMVPRCSHEHSRSLAHVARRREGERMSVRFERVGRERGEARRVDRYASGAGCDRVTDLLAELRRLGT